MKLTEILQNARSKELLSSIYTPEIKIFETSEEVDVFAAEQLIQQIQIKPDSILTLPTGVTPIGMYEHLVDAYNQGIVDFSAVTIFNLDEYYPISQQHPSSYTAFMKKYFIDHVHVLEWDIPNGEAQNPVLEAKRYRQHLEEYQPIDFAVLGIGPGTTCHIGFNEKGSSVESTVRYIPLHSETRETNARLFDNLEEIPDGTITQGISDILQTEQILVLAKGESKSWGVNRALKGLISPDAPASFLRLHPNVTFVLDQFAGQYIR